MSDVLSYPVEDSASQEVLYVESVRMNDTRIESSSGSQLDQSALTVDSNIFLKFLNTFIKYEENFFFLRPLLINL